MEKNELPLIGFSWPLNVSIVDVDLTGLSTTRRVVLFSKLEVGVDHRAFTDEEVNFKVDSYLGRANDCTYDKHGIDTEAD